MEEDDYTYSLTLKFAKPHEERRKKGSTSMDRRPKTPASDHRFMRAHSDVERHPRTPVRHDREERYSRPPVSRRRDPDSVSYHRDTDAERRRDPDSERPPRTPVSHHSVTTGGWGHHADVPSSDSRKPKSPAEVAIKKIEKEEVQFEKENYQVRKIFKAGLQFVKESDFSARRHLEAL